MPELYKGALGYDGVSPVLGIDAHIGVPVVFPVVHPHAPFVRYGDTADGLEITSGDNWIRFTSTTNETETTLPLSFGYSSFNVVSLAPLGILRFTLSTSWVPGRDTPYVLADLFQDVPIVGDNYAERRHNPIATYYGSDLVNTPVRDAGGVSFYIESGHVNQSLTTELYDLFYRYRATVGVMMQSNSGGWTQFDFSQV